MSCSFGNVKIVTTLYKNSPLLLKQTTKVKKLKTVQVVGVLK